MKARPAKILTAVIVGLAFSVPQLLRAEWLYNGNPISEVGEADHCLPDIAADGHGGAIITWSSFNASPTSWIYAQRIDADGGVLWPTGGIVACAQSGCKRYPIIGIDNSGKAIIVWEDSRNGSGDSDIYAQMLDPSGSLCWPPEGVPICVAPNEQESAKMVVDVSRGGAIIVWSDRRAGRTYYDIYAQSVDGDGNVLWTQNGVRVFSGVNRCTGLFDVVSDGSGGAIVVWQKRNWGQDEYDIFAQRIDHRGNCRWTTDGAPVCAASGEQVMPRIVPAGNGSFIIAWCDSRSGNADIYAQKMSGDGLPQWASGGICVCSAAGDQRAPSVLAMADGGATIAWEDGRAGNFDIYAQRLGSNGELRWVLGGVPVCTEATDQTLPMLISSVAGGTIVTWYDTRLFGVGIFAQRINGNGSTLWDAGGLAVCHTTPPHPKDCRSRMVVSDGAGGAMVSWEDYRYGSATVFAQRIDSEVQDWVTAAGVPKTSMLYQNYPNPFNPSTSIKFYLSEKTMVRLEIYGVSGERVTSLIDGEREKGSYIATWDGKDDHGNGVASGVYFCRLIAGTQRMSRKMVLLR